MRNITITVSVIVATMSLFLGGCAGGFSEGSSAQSPNDDSWVQQQQAAANQQQQDLVQMQQGLQQTQQAQDQANQMQEQINMDQQIRMMQP